jgi:ribosome-associated protein
MIDLIKITDAITLDPSQLEWHFVRASGPGGQNVNKVASAVQLRFDVAEADLPEAVRARVIALGGQRVTRDGVLVIDARRFRTQVRNRQDALDRLVALIRDAARPPKLRRPVKTPAAVRRKRLESKRRRAATKSLRKPVADE